MYQAQITATRDGDTTDLATATLMSHLLGGSGRAETVDAEQSIWLIDIDSTNEEILEREGYLTAALVGYIVEIEMP